MLSAGREPEWKGSAPQVGGSLERPADPTHTPSGNGETVALVAIVKDEDAFIHEWLAYHRLIGVSHFYLYDNDSHTPLRDVVKLHSGYVTVIDWPGRHENLTGREPRGRTAHLRNNQTKAYEDALQYVAEPWVGFIDIDEFIVLRRHAALPEFLTSFPDAGAVRLSWYYFGHDGHLDTPEGLVISTHLRRRSAPGRMHKSINRTRAILTIPNAHDCVLARPHDRAVDANGRPYSHEPYPGKTDVAHVNHYVYRSFREFMGRVDRGEAAFSKDDAPPDQRWRFEPEGRLRKFVEDAKDKTQTWSEAAEDRLLQRIHVGVMPLRDGAWEHGKSACKLLQYMAAARPVVASPVGTARMVVTPGVNGLFATSDGEWVTAIDTLRADRAAAATMGSAARRTVEASYSLEHTLPAIADVLLAAAGARTAGLRNLPGASRCPGQAWT